MPRQLRVEFPGAIYHVMSRGDRREAIFLDDVDRQDFLKTLAEACQKTGWQIHAYCLMGNHFHLVVETPDANLVAGMRWLLSAYTIGLNHRHKLFGHVFSGRYKALLVVIAILAILTAFLLPALSSGKGQAQAASCMANVRQLQLAWQMYAHDNQDRLVLNAWTNRPDGSWVYFQSANTAQLSAARLGCSTRGRSELTVRPKHDSQSPTG